jgi:hypothetical protein
LRPELDATGLGARTSFTGARADQISLELGQAAEHGQGIRRPCGIVVSAHASPSERKPALRSAIAASVFNRSRVDRARRSEPRHRQHVAGVEHVENRRNCARSVFAPVATSRNTFLQPTLVSWRT